MKTPLIYSLFLCLVSSPLMAQSYSQGTEGVNSPFGAPGTPASSYALSGIDTVNYLNGNLVIQIPVTTMGGRGSAANTIRIPTQTQWSVLFTSDGAGGSFVPTGNTTSFEDGWDYTSGWITVMTASADPNACEVLNNGVWTFEGLGPYVSWVVGEAPNGTQTVLVDTTYNGQPQNAQINSCAALSGYTPADRGRTFRSVDGSGMTFIANTDVTDAGNQVTGTLYFRDGTHYNFSNITLPANIEDRNGNQMTYAFQSTSSGGIYTVTDPTSRQSTINFTENPPSDSQDVITYPGYAGASRKIYINYAQLQNALSSGQILATPKTLFPELQGSSSTYYNPWVISSIELADGTSYTLQYDSYGEVTKLTLPTGGAYEYSYGAGCPAGSPPISTSICNTDGVIELNKTTTPNYIIYRRVTERDELSNGSAISARTTFSATAAQSIDSNNPSVPGTKVTVAYENPAGTALRSETHLFYGDPTLSWSFAGTPNPTLYSPWVEGLEFQSTVSDPSYGNSVKTQKVMTQRPWGAPDNTGDEWFTASTITSPAHDPQTCLVKTTVDSGVASGVQYAYDNYNNVNYKWEFDYSNTVPAVGATCPGTPGASAFTRSTYFWYGLGSAYDNLNITNLPTTEVISNNSGTSVWATFSYDQNAVTGDSGIVGHDETNYGTGFNTRGNLTEVQQYSYELGTWLNAYLTYDEAGNVTSAKDRNSNTATLAYNDPNNTYAHPTTVKNALSQSATGVWDYYSQKPAQMGDANGFITAYWYNDPLDRVTQMARAWGQGAESNVTYTYNSPTEVTTQQDQVSLGDGALKSVRQYDGLGRPTVSQQYESGTSAITTTTTYDALGRVSTVTNPMRSGDTQYLTAYSYDAFGRTRSVVAPDNSATGTAFSGNTATVTDAAAHKRETTTDALGRLTKVQEDPNGVNYSTTYTYNVMDELLTVTQGSQTRTYTWNTLQQMASATNPESRAVSYGYDSNSNLTSRKDARNITTSYTYDALNRLKTATYNDGVTPNVTYAYDTATNGKGLLASVTSSAATDTVASYDARGNVAASSQTIGGHAYNFSYTYNLADAPKSTTYPSGRMVTNTYDGANRVATVASGSTTYLSGVSYAAFGGFAGHTYGNGLARAYSYNSLLQPSEMKDTGGGYTLLDNVLNWTAGSNNGNLPGQTVTHNGPNFSGGQIQFSPSYGYDTLNRLTSAGETGNWSQSFGYDQYGNMWLSGDSGTLPTQVLMPASSGAYNAANNRLSAQTYDAAGNQETYSTYTLTYDAENRQTKASDSSSGETYTYSYDGLGERTSKTAQGVTTSYVHDAFGNLAAEYTSDAPVDQPCTTCYLSWDHLGSTRLVTDSGGVVVARHDFLPFGQELSGGFGGRNDFWGQTDQVTAKFTGQEHDVETALDFFQARYHANQQGRFLSADPGQAGADPGNPQSWNGYGYVLGNPLAFADPNGRSCITLDDGSQGDDGDGLGCADAGVAPGSAGDPSTLNQGQTNAQVNARNPSELEYLWTISTNQIPIYSENDVPINPSANTILRQVATNTAGFPDVCSGGAFVYGGVQGKYKGVHGGLAYLGNYDSKSGWTNNGLGEVSGDQVGVGAAAGHGSAEGLVFLPLGDVGGGLVGVSKNGLAIGGYLGTPENFPIGGGGGAYANISTMGSCRQY